METVVLNIQSAFSIPALPIDLLPKIVEAVRSVLQDASPTTVVRSDFISPRPLSVSMPIAAPKQWPVANLEADIAELRQLILDNPSAIAMFELLYHIPGRPVYFPQIIEKAGRTKREGMIDLKQFTDVIYRRWDKTRYWPIQWTQEKGRGTYRISREVAAAWRAAKGEDKELVPYDQMVEEEKKRLREKK